MIATVPKVLGLHWGHDAGAAIVEDGAVIAAASEERFTRMKHYCGFPSQAVQSVLRRSQTELHELETIAVTPETLLDILKSDPWTILKLKSHIEDIVLDITSGEWSPTGILQLLHPSKDEKALDQIALPVQMSSISHHLAHAASAYYCSGFRNGNVVTLDGIGGLVSGTLSIVEGGRIRQVKKFGNRDSLGHFYACLTEGLGFKVNDQEWKVMGLASYGRPVASIMEDLRPLLPPRRWRLTGKLQDNVLVASFSEAASVKAIAQHYGMADVAASGQRLFEERVLSLVESFVSRHKTEELSAAGGCFLNVRSNMLIRQHLSLKPFIQPNAGDGGIPVGAALEASRQLHDSRNRRMTHCFLGPSYTDSEILRVIERYGLGYEHCDDIGGICAELLAKDQNLLGWFQGRMEWGPRALGARSCLADPRDRKVKHKINSTIKRREEFLPYCPTILDRAAPEYLRDYEPVPTSPFMIDLWEVTQALIEDAPAVVHVDGTTRPQILERDLTDETQRYYRLIEEFESISGVPCVLNTSLNLHGKPIVCSPEDVVLECLPYLDYVAMGNFLLKGGLKGQFPKYNDTSRKAR